MIIINNILEYKKVNAHLGEKLFLAVSIGAFAGSSHIRF